MQQSLFTTAETGIYHFEDRARSEGYLIIAGVDEAGRGPLAGPVIAAAVIIDPARPLEGVNDSKKLTARQRELLFDLIMEKAVSVGIGSGSPELIDSINILQATRRAMLEAINQLSPVPDCLLIDGITPVETTIRQLTIKQGDSRSASIAAASIIAKVTRDRIMVGYDAEYPQYGFAGHKGYGSAAHLAALAIHGPSPIHRRTFGGVKELLT